MFFLIKVFRSSKQGVRYLDHIRRHADTSLSPFQDEPSITSYCKVMAIRGRSQERGGQCKGYYCGHLRKPSGQLLGNPRMVVSHVPIVYSSPQSLRPYLLKDSSLSIYPVLQSCLYYPLSTKSLSHSNPSYSFL